MYMTIYSLFGYESNVNKHPSCFFVCKFFSLNKGSGKGGIGGKAQRLPPKAHWKHLLSHARFWVECDAQGVYATRHAPWKHAEGRLDTTMHNSLLGCYHRVGLRSP